jgi:hypothetical protein
MITQLCTTGLANRARGTTSFCDQGGIPLAGSLAHPLMTAVFAHQIADTKVKGNL